MDFSTISTILFLIGIVSFVSGLIMYSVEHTKKVEDSVKETSERYNFLLNISKELVTEKLEAQYTYPWRMKSKVQLDRLDLTAQMMNLVSQDIPPSDLYSKAVKFSNPGPRRFD